MESTLTALAAKACMPLACATEIARVASAEASVGFKVWVPFEVARQLARHPIAYNTRRSQFTYAGSVFSSLEKATEAYPCTSSQQYIYIPYRMHKCGDPSVVYVYVHDGHNITITNIAEDLWEQIRAMGDPFIKSIEEMDELKFRIDEIM